MKKIALHLGDRLFVVFFALLFLQAPLFILQYRQQLTGRVEELRWEVAHMEKAAQKADKSIAAYIDKFKKSNDSDIASQGVMMAKIEKRHQNLSQGLRSLTQASAWTRIFKFFYYFQSDVAASTLKNFTPGIPLSTEGILWGVIGGIFGYSLFSLLIAKRKTGDPSGSPVH